MGRELESIGQITSVGDLPHRLTEAEEAKVEVEGQLLERVSVWHALGSISSCAILQNDPNFTERAPTRDERRVGAVRTKDERRQELAGQGSTDPWIAPEQEEASQGPARDKRENVERCHHTEDQNQPEYGEAAGALPVGCRRWRLQGRRGRGRAHHRARRPQRYRQRPDYLARGLSRATRSVSTG